jgi:aerobic C4-dicarboxylate transport protein
LGTGVATIVVAKWEGELDEARLRAVLRHESAEEAEEPEKVLLGTS